MYKSQHKSSCQFYSEYLLSIYLVLEPVTGDRHDGKNCNVISRPLTDGVNRKEKYDWRR